MRPTPLPKVEAAPVIESKEQLSFEGGEPDFHDDVSGDDASIEPEVDPKAEIRALRKERKMLKKKEKTPKELAALKKEEITLKRKAHKINVRGTDIPLHCET